MQASTNRLAARTWPGPRVFNWSAWRRWLAGPASLVVAAGLLVLLPAQLAAASSVTSAAFTGGAGTVSVGGTLYAKQGAGLTLTFATSSDTKCVDVAGAFSAHDTSSTAKSSWTFGFSAGAGDGVRTVTVTASPSFNPQGNCTGSSGSRTATVVLDNTGPVVTGSLSPTPNAAGWNKANTTLTWTATDAGSGVASGPTPVTSVEASDGIYLRSSSATDRLGNTGSGSTTVRVDKTAPAISATQTTSGNQTTVTFTCTDAGPGGAAPSGIASCLADGSATNAKTITGDGTVTGTATDVAGNTKTMSVSVETADTTPPTLSGSPTTPPNANDWYRDDVTIDWTCGDAGGSGLAAGACPADSTIGGEGTGLTSTRSVSDIAGNTTTATSAPAVRIDRSAPTTGITGASNGWVNGDVTVMLAASDALSGIAATFYTVDGGPTQTGDSFTLSAEGSHDITYWSRDRAGNLEPAQSATVRIDRTAPTITHGFTPSSYTDGTWTNSNVTVTFQCADQGGSGVASCTEPVTTTTEGATQPVVGTASDGAGNSATDTASVSIDKTAPTITARRDRAANTAGWYRDDVTVSFLCEDTLSGIDSCSAPITLGEGAAQSAAGSARDAAGNVASDEITGIDVDKTAPTLSGSFGPGWHTGDVPVGWTCADTLSGPKDQPDDTVVTGEGSNLTATATCEDLAGNQVRKTVSGIQIDRTPPTTTAGLPELPESGWYSAPVDVTLLGDDNLSGLDVSRYSIDGGQAQDYSGAFTVATNGTHTVEFWSRDVAGNIELHQSVDIAVDRTAPTTVVTNPISPASGWFVTSGIPFAFEATDGHSGVAATYYEIDDGPTQTYGEPFTENLSNGAHTVTYWSVDIAGNVEVKDSFPVQVDVLPPTITADRTPVPNSYGWNNSNVTVSFSCTDADSGIDGIAGCGPDQTVSSEGAGQQVQGDTMDVAGNESSTTVDDINIDKTRPSLVGAATTDPNAAGWYNGDVVIAWSGDDGLSGLDLESQPANDIVTGEGRNLGASASIRDKAGNARSATLDGFKIDRVAPTVSGAPTAAPNGAGWYRSKVTVAFSCVDPALADGSAGSGVAECPLDRVLDEDGVDLSVTSGTASDKAGNVTAGKTVGGINIDGHEPQTTADNRCTSNNGYCTGSTATVVLTAGDVGPSGVKEIRYRVNGGDEQVAPGATKAVSVPLDGTGTADVTYYAVDVAGNRETTQQVVLRYDNIAPTVTHTVSPPANAADWHNSDVTVHFDARDTDPGSGVDPSTVTPDRVVSTETSGRVVNGSAADFAGNTGTDSVMVKLDKTAPNISGAITAGTMGDNGWYAGPVTVHYTCSDALSGLAGTCPDDVIVTENGANQSATARVSDVADNSASATVSGIKIDRELPTIGDVNVAGGFYTLGAVPAPTCNATDSFSGLSSCRVTVSGGTANGVGTFAYTARATDRAGNTATQTGTYRVVYRFGGFLQPINDTAHQVGTSISVFKGGSTVPVKFQLKQADGTVVQAAAAPVWLTPVQGSRMSMPVDESLYSAPADSGATYRYDATARQYIYNWKTAGSGSYWRIGVRLDDGQTYYVNIGLR